jgi:chitodextrinase
MARLHFSSTSFLSVIAVVMLVVGLVIAVIGARQQQDQRSSAAEPKVGDQVISNQAISSANNTGYTKTGLLPGAEYKIVISGTFKFNSDSSADPMRADAQWIAHGTGAYNDHNNAVGFNGTQYTSSNYKTSVSPTHTYTWYLIPGSSLKMNIVDSNYSDNTGSLTVNMYLNKLPPPSVTAIVKASDINCISQPYTGSGVTIAWTGTGVTVVDISTTSGFSSYYRKSVTGLTSTTAPSGFMSGTTPLSLTPGQTYYVRVSNGTNSPAKSFSLPACTNDTTPPSAPTNLKATAISQSQINLTWNVSTDNVGVTCYKVYRDGVMIATTTTNSYQNTGLTASTTYKYQVTACDAAGNESTKSNEAQATTFASPDTTPPSIPTNLTATAISTSQINLSWNASTDNVGVTCYKVFRNGNQVAMVTTTTYQDTGLSSDTLYTYQVSACDAAGNNSEKSNEATARTLKPAAPTTKLNFDLFMHGIGKAGDAANPGENGGGNTNIVHLQRKVFLDLTDLDNNVFIQNKEVLVVYNSVSGSFKGAVEILPSADIEDEEARDAFVTGSYVVKVKMEQSLRASIARNLTVGGENTIPTTYLISGDINNDNKINIVDYDILIGCYSDFLPAEDCTPQKKIQADITDDGSVNAFDYNLFLRELSNLEGN